MDKYSKEENLAFDAGVDHEKSRVLKIFDRYHEAVCEGRLEDHPGCEKSMSLKYIYQYLFKEDSK